MAAVLRPLQFDDNEVSHTVDRQQINASFALLPVAKLLCHDKKIFAKNPDLVTKKTLEITSLGDAQF